MRFAPLILLFASLGAGAQTTPEALYQRGQRYAELSVQSFDKLLQTAPESGYVLALLGEVKSQERQYTAAIYAYTEAAKRMPRLRGVQTGLEKIYQTLHKPEEASAASKAEAQLGPPDCTAEKIYCDYSSGKFDQVVAAASRKAGPEGIYWLVRAYNQLSLQTFAQLGELPDSAQLHRVKAQILRDEEQYRESVEEWRKVLTFAPDDRNAQHELATALYLSHDFKATLPELQQFLRKEPNSANLNFFVGDSLLETEQIEPAIPYLQTALKLNPKLVPAHASLGLCYARLGEQKQAIPHLQAALALDKDGSLHYQLARAYQATGRPALAKAMMEQYQQLRKPAAVTAPVP